MSGIDELKLACDNLWSAFTVMESVQTREIDLVYAFCGVFFLFLMIALH
jgi:hypothetical protein